MYSKDSSVLVTLWRNNGNIIWVNEIEHTAQMLCKNGQLRSYAKSSIFIPIGFEKDVAKHLNVSLKINQRVLPTPDIYYTHVTSAMFEHSCVSSWIKDTCVRKLPTSVKWLLAYFSLCFLCFENFNNVKKSYSLSSVLRCKIFLFENNTTLIDVFEHFHDEKKSSKSSSFMLIFRLDGTLYICKLDGSY